LTRATPPSKSPSATSWLRIALAVLVTGGLIALAAGVAYMIITGRSLPFALSDSQSQTTSEVSTNDLTAFPEATASPTDPVPTATAMPFATPTETPTSGPPMQRAIVNTDTVDLYSGPGIGYPVIGQATLGQPFHPVAQDSGGNWLEICCPAQPITATAWISAELVAVIGSIATLPVSTPPPMPPTAEAPVVETVPQSANPAAAQARPAAGIPGPGGFGAPGENNPLTGLPLPPEERNRRPLIVCINNDYAARPQFGTSRAAVIYEYLMEGYGITRFSAIYYGAGSEQIGPVRSARLINLSLGALYDAGLVCSGASDPVRFSLKNDAPFPYMDIDLDDPSNNRYTVSLGQDYRTRLRTSTDGMRRWLADWSQERAPSLRGFTFGDLPVGGAPATAINIPYPTATGSQVAYRYDPGSGRYLRFLGGVPHLDGNSGSQLALETVIVQYVPHEPTDIVEDSLGSTSIGINLFGGGRAMLFRNGVGFEGTWKSESQGDTPHFYDGEGREIPLKPGNSWISVVPLTYAIAYQ
jgi:hypothetical protein